MADQGDSESAVKEALETFMKKHDREASISCIDEIVLAYMVSVLEELGSDDATEDDFDVEAFTDMMKEYLPSFDEIDSVLITEWMFELAQSLMKKPSKGSAPVLSFVPPPAESIAVTAPKRERRTSSMSDKDDYGSPQQNGGVRCVLEDEEDDAEVAVLSEMFPGSCRMEVAHCLCVAGGDVDRAAQLLLHRQESGEAISQATAAQVQNPCMKRGARKNDHDMKKKIVEQYSFVDTDEDKREHRPILPKKDSKKMVRYLDSKVVSLKGERFTEIKKDDEEEKMKKTFVNLKPARQYRFH